MIPYGKQSLNDEDIQAVIDTLQSDFLTQGDKVPQFEAEMASYCGADHAVAMNSATSALHLACLALGLGSGDILWTSPISFVASSNCALYCGATVDFVDIDPSTGNLSMSALAQKFAEAKQKGRLPKILVAVHFSGQPCDMESIRSLCKQYDCNVIEDAAHAVGSRYQAHATGSCYYSDITIFSFHPVKVITSGEGGMALTNNADWAARMRLLSSHGVTRENLDQELGSLTGAWVYHQIELGFNYRMSDLHASLGLSQLNRLDAFVERRNEIAKIYDQAFADTEIEVLEVGKDRCSSFHLYSIRLPARLKREACFDRLRQEGIGVNVHYIPIYKQPYYRDLGFADNYCPNAEAFYAGLITLPLYPAMSTQDIEFVIDKVTKVLSYDSADVTNSVGES